MFSADEQLVLRLLRGWWSTRRMNRTRGGLGTFDAGSGLLQQASVLFQNIVNAIDANPANEQQQRISEEIKSVTKKAALEWCMVSKIWLP